MEKPKTLEQLRAEKKRAETRLAQEQHKLHRLENRKKFLEQGERKKRTHRLCNLGGTDSERKLEGKFRKIGNQSHSRGRGAGDFGACFPAGKSGGRDGTLARKGCLLRRYPFLFRQHLTEVVVCCILFS